MVMTRNDIADVHRLDSKPNPNITGWLSSPSYTPSRIPDRQFSGIIESDMEMCPDFTDRWLEAVRVWAPQSFETVSMKKALPMSGLAGNSFREGGDLSELEEVPFLSLKRFTQHSSGCPHGEFLLVFLD